jgi:hypothetical protein
MAGEAIDAAEAFADGRIDKAKLKEVFKAAEAAARRARSDRSAHFVVRDVARLSAQHSCWYVAWFTAYVGDDMPAGREGEWKRQAALLRDIFGNPFRPLAINPAWLAWNDGTVPRIAQAIYDERAFDRMPVLADALEDAGCTEPYILDHCRQPGEHVRGCWVVDLLLGKE